eukprot:2385128-Pyramimonas_sp.AAC.1
MASASQPPSRRRPLRTLRRAANAGKVMLRLVLLMLTSLLLASVVPYRLPLGRCSVPTDPMMMLKAENGHECQMTTYEILCVQSGMVSKNPCKKKLAKRSPAWLQSQTEWPFRPWRPSGSSSMGKPPLLTSRYSPQFDVHAARLGEHDERMDKHDEKLQALQGELAEFKKLLAVAEERPVVPVA